MHRSGGKEIQRRQPVILLPTDTKNISIHSLRANIIDMKFHYRTVHFTVSWHNKVSLCILKTNKISLDS